jgi:hypothetical protein
VELVILMLVTETRVRNYAPVLAATDVTNRRHADSRVRCRVLMDMFSIGTFLVLCSYHVVSKLVVAVYANYGIPATIRQSYGFNFIVYHKTGLISL